MTNEGVLSPAEVEERKKTIEAEIEEAFHFARSSPFPSQEELYLHLCAD